MGPLRERYFIQKIVLFHTARHIYGINHDLLRLFFRKPSQCSGLFDYHSLSAVVFENAFNRCEPHKFIQQPHAGAVFSLWKQDKPSKAAQIKRFWQNNRTPNSCRIPPAAEYLPDGMKSPVCRRSDCRRQCLRPS